MKRKLLFLCVFYIMVFVQSANAEESSDNYYVSLHGGIGWGADIDRSVNNGFRVATIELESPFGFTAAVGKSMNDWLRLEGELGFIKANTDEVINNFGGDTDESGNEQFFNIMINAIADFKNSSRFTPFIGGGIGAVYAKHEINFDPIITDTIPGVDSNESEWVFGYQFMAGVDYQYSSQLIFDLQYRYFGVGSRDYTQNTPVTADVELDSTNIHMIMLGLRYSF